MATQTSSIGDVTISTVSIHSTKGTLNATERAIQISVFETIFMPAIYAELIIRDDGSLSSYLPLSGEETINIEFSADSRKEAKYELTIISMEGGAQEAGGRSKSYAIKAISPEIHEHQRSKIMKSYNTNISDVVKDVCTKYLKTKKKVDVQDTKGIQSLALTNKKPFEAIDLIRKRAVSEEDKSSSYVFFENQDGFVFKTIEKLFSEGDTGDRVFTHDSTIRTDATASGFRNIIAYNQPKGFNSSSKVGGGGLKNQVKTLDMKTLTFNKADHEVDVGQFKSADGSMKDNNSSEFKSKFGETAATHSFIPLDGYRPNTNINDATSDQKGFISQLAQSSINFLVIGDSELTAGKLMEAKLNDVSSASGGGGEDTQISGKYLMTAVRHMIGPDGQQPRYTCSIEGVKGGNRE
jgi:hypothetical protein